MTPIHTRVLSWACLWYNGRMAQFSRTEYLSLVEAMGQQALSLVAALRPLLAQASILRTATVLDDRAPAEGSGDGSVSAGVDTETAGRAGQVTRLVAACETLSAEASLLCNAYVEPQETPAPDRVWGGEDVPVSETPPAIGFPKMWGPSVVREPL